MHHFERPPRWRCAFAMVCAVAGAVLLSLNPLIAGTRLVAGAAAPPTAAAVPGPEPRVRWTRQLRGPIAAPPAVTATDVYVGTETGGLTALDVATGTTRWQVLLPAPVQTPAVTGSLVVVASGRLLLAFDAVRGERRWAITVDHVLSGPAVACGLVYAGSWGGRLTAIVAATGEMAWRAQTDEATVLSVPTIAGDTVLISSETGAVHAFDARTGNRRWRTQTGPGPGPPRVAGATNAIYAGGSATAGAHHHAGFLVAVDAHTGREIWRLATDDWVSAAPVPAGQGIIVGTWSGRLLSLAPAGFRAPI